MTEQPTDPHRMDTEAEIIERLRQEGWSLDLHVTQDGRVRGEGCEWPADEVTVRVVRRFEGSSDPGDEAMVLGVEGPDGSRGVLALPYGPDMTSPQIDAVQSLVLGRST